MDVSDGGILGGDKTKKAFSCLRKRLFQLTVNALYTATLLKLLFLPMGKGNNNMRYVRIVWSSVSNTNFRALCSSGRDDFFTRRTVALATNLLALAHSSYFRPHTRFYRFRKFSGLTSR
jgi:hypothetical protein